MSSSDISSPSPSPLPLTLWIYDHCPYCIRVLLLIGLKSLPVEIKYLPNGDEKSHIDLCGKKVVPILRKADGTILLESLDIVKYLDNYDGKSILRDGNADTKVFQTWSQNNKLTHPRFVQLGLPEFQREEDIQYFTTKKTKDIGDFKENLQNSKSLIEEEEKKIISVLLPIFPSVEELKKGKGGLHGDFSYDDIHLFPRLRSLTSVKGFQFPENISYYLHNLAKISKVNLYDTKAV